MFSNEEQAIGDSSKTPESRAPKPARRRRFIMVVKVVELRLRFIALLAATGLTFAYWDEIWNRYDKWMRPRVEQSFAAAGLEYYCPMHPHVVQDEPGTARSAACRWPKGRASKRRGL